MDYVTPDGSSEYMTRDMYEAAAIHAQGIPVKNVVRDGDVCYFVFDGASKCDELAMNYRNKELVCDAKTLIEALRTMKDFIYNTTRRG
jgi:hypothetical protein